WVAIEDLQVKGMMANRHLARHIADASWGELRRQLAYKAQMRGVHLAVVDRWYPSSKTCSVCQVVNHALTLAERRWTCSACGTGHERDVNAAKNILAQSLKDAAPGSESIKAAGVAASACGEEGAGATRKNRVKPSSLKQEVQV